MNEARATLRSLANSPVASRVVASAADLALVLDQDGVILEVAVGDALEAHPGWDKLVGKRWAETIAKDSQAKIDLLLTEAREGKATRPRELNQKAEGLGEIPLKFNAVMLEDRERVVAVGRDLRPLAAMQQRMVSNQQAMDRDYNRLRQADTRYRLLFHVASEGVMVVDGVTRKVLEANPAAATMLGELPAALQGKAAADLFQPRNRTAVQALFAALDAGARPADLQVALLANKDSEVNLSAFLFKQSGAPLVLLRFSLLGASVNNAASKRTSLMMAVLNTMPDGFVVTGEDRRVLNANAAFCELVQQANESQVIGQGLDRWIGRPGVDLNIIVANLREHGTVKNFATIVRGDYGQPQEGLVTAVAALDGKVPCFGFTIRTVSSRLTTAPSTMTTMPRSVEQIHELVGRVPLKELVREAGDMVERLCIVAALEVSGNNRASAAQLLGLSRQGLYSKLRRHKIAEFGGAASSA